MEKIDLEKQRIQLELQEKRISAELLNSQQKILDSLLKKYALEK